MNYVHKVLLAGSFVLGAVAFSNTNTATTDQPVAADNTAVNKRDTGAR